MVMAAEEEKPIQQVLSLPILLADRVVKSAQDAQSFKPENLEHANKVIELSHHLRSAARLAASSTAFYDRPIRRVSVDLTKALDRALTLARKCRHKKTNVLHHVLSITTAADFKKVSALLDSSLGDIKWVLSIFNQDSDHGGAINLSLPPIASTDPMLAWVWAYIAAVHMGRAEAANELATLAHNNERNKNIILEENGIPPLLKMLKERSNFEAQTAAATALCNLADNQSRVRSIAEASGVLIVSKVLPEVSMRVQVTLANLVSKMSEIDFNVQENFGRENITRPLVTLLGMDIDLDEFKEANNPKKTVSSFHSLVEINKEMTKKSITSYGSSDSLEGSSKHRKEKERESESPEVKRSLKTSCANALWKLARGSLWNSKKITETKALLVLAKTIENEKGDLKMNCLMVVMELAAVAESNNDLKRAAFKPTSTAGKVVLDQLIRVINEDFSNPGFVVPAIKAIGCLASMFPAKDKRIVQSLVSNLGHRNLDIGGEAAKALGKFVREDNYNRKEHTQVIIEFDGVPKLMRYLKSNDKGDLNLHLHLHLHEAVLLCNLAINEGNSKALEKAGALRVVKQATECAVVNQNPDLRELFAKAIHQLTIYQAGAVHTHRHT